MTAVDTADARGAGFIAAIAETARRCRPAPQVCEQPDGIELLPSDEGGFAVRVHVTEGEVRIALGPWSHAIARDADPEDDEDALALAHDLVAAALWGRARLRIEWKGEQPWRTTVCFGAPGRWLTFERVGGGLRAPWVRLRVEERINRGRPPRQISDKRLRPLPWAPWAGTRGQARHQPAPVELPVTGELDLHSFNPKDVKPLVLEYIEQCRAKGITELRIVHGKGIGNLRRTVHALLDRHSAVATYRLGGHGGGGWGATVVDLIAESSDTDDGDE